MLIFVVIWHQKNPLLRKIKRLPGIILCIFSSFSLHTLGPVGTKLGDLLKYQLHLKTEKVKTIECSLTRMKN